MKKIVIGEEIESPMKRGFNFTLSFADDVKSIIVIENAVQANRLADALSDNMYASRDNCTLKLVEFLAYFEWPKDEDDYYREYLSFDVKYISNTGDVYSTTIEEDPPKKVNVAMQNDYNSAKGPFVFLNKESSNEQS